MSRLQDVQVGDKIVPLLVLLFGGLPSKDGQPQRGVSVRYTRETRVGVTKEAWGGPTLVSRPAAFMAASWS